MLYLIYTKSYSSSLPHPNDRFRKVHSWIMHIYIFTKLGSLGNNEPELLGELNTKNSSEILGSGSLSNHPPICKYVLGIFLHFHCLILMLVKLMSSFPIKWLSWKETVMLHLYSRALSNKISSLCLNLGMESFPSFSITWDIKDLMLNGCWAMSVLSVLYHTDGWSN